MISPIKFKKILKITSPFISRINPSLRVKLAKILRHQGIQTLFDPNSLSIFSKINKETHLEKVNYFGGTTLIVDINEIVGFRTAVNGKWDLTSFNLINKLNEKNMIFIDIGAHIGTSSVPIANLGVQVICFEANLNSAQLLLSNISLNKIPKIIVFPFAIGSTGETGSWLQLSTYSGNIAASSLLSNWGAGKELLSKKYVYVTSLDETLRFLGLMEDPKNLVIKVDVEGYEREVFKGAKEAINLHRPIIIFENNPIFSDQDKQEEIFYSHFINYSFFSISQELILSDFDINTRYENAIAIPDEKRKEFFI